MSGEFVDTNILVYAHDKSAGGKREAAADLLLRLLDDSKGLLSVQVLMEFFVAVTRKIPKPLSPKTASQVIRDLSFWTVFSPAAEDVLAGIGIADKYRISFWDAMIVRAAQATGASVLWSEDLNHGQIYEGVEVKNPFR